jgi:protein SCO1/2
MKVKILFILFVLISCFAMAKDKGVPNTESVYNVNSTWINQENKNVQLKNFSGNAVVMAMVYTSCQAACPLIVNDMQKIENTLTAEQKEKVKFVLVSFDSEKDLAGELKHFGQAHGLDLKRWSLMSGKAEDVRELAAVLGVQYKKDSDGEFSHSNIITVLDKDGRISYQQKGLQQDPKKSSQAISEILNKKS